MGNQQERLDKKLAWLAGILEGEGWVSLALVRNHQKKNSFTPGYQPNIGMVNCDMKIMDEVESIIKSLDIKYRKNYRKALIGTDGISRKAKVEISIAAHEGIKKMCQIMIPYMIGDKADRCVKLLKYLEIRANKPRSGINSRYGREEYNIYQALYSYKGKRSTRSRILNDYTLGFEESDKI